MRRLVLAAVLPLVLIACSGQGTTAAVGTPTPTPQPVVSPAAGLGAAQCRPPTPLRDIGMGIEAQGSSSAGVSLWGLIMAGPLPSPIQAGHQAKIVWRMTGTGDFQVVAFGPGGRQKGTDWGPDEHLGSNWNRPGSEWGTGFTFPVAGCWDLHATRGDGAGDMYIVVTP